jgi:preprotein translocase subunit SecF
MLPLLKLIPDDTNIRFVRWRWVAAVVSLLLLGGSILLLGVRGLNYGVDFAGGVMMEVGFDQAAPLDELRDTMGALGVGEASLQQFGSPDVVAIRMPLPRGAGESGGEEAVQQLVARVQSAIQEDHPDASVRRVETVTGKVSDELQTDGMWAAILAMLGVALYIWFRFEWQFGVGALLALVHDVVLTLGFFALTQLEFNLNIVAAVLTIIGYSLNDTIVIYDRIRENLRRYRKMEIAELLDLSVNETLARTIVTSLSMVLALTALLVLGGEVLRGFSAAMLLGIGIGTFSSIYVAAPVLLWLRVGSDSFVGQDAKAKSAP